MNVELSPRAREVITVAVRGLIGMTTLEVFAEDGRRIAALAETAEGFRSAEAQDNGMPARFRLISADGGVDISGTAGGKDAAVPLRFDKTPFIRGQGVRVISFNMAAG